MTKVLKDKSCIIEYIEIESLRICNIWWGKYIDRIFLVLEIGSCNM